MKDLRFKIPFLVVILISLYNCSNDDYSELPVAYYQFSELDKNQLLIEVPEEDDIITFKNQLDEFISLRVQQSDFGRIGAYSQGTFSGGGGNLLYYYDTQTIEMEFLDIPDPFATFELRILKTQDNMLRGSLYFELWNKPSDSFSNIPERLVIDFETAASQMTINGSLYNDILVFSSLEEEIAGSWFGLDRNVHTMYYDKKHGFVGFDDLDGNQWRIFN